MNSAASVQNVLLDRLNHNFWAELDRQSIVNTVRAGVAVRETEGKHTGDLGHESSHKARPTLRRSSPRPD